MKYIIAVDLEGVAGVVGSVGKTLTDSPDYAFACQQGVREANAAAGALFAAGATEVLVWDNHGSGHNLACEQLDRRCRIILGSGGPHRWPGLDSSFAGVLLIGYHAMDNTINGVLAHSYNSQVYQWLKINNTEVGEIAIDAAMAGECHGVPVIFVSSDDHGVSEAKRFLPWIETVSTKIGLGRNLAVSQHPLAVLDEISRAVGKAVAGIDTMQAFAFTRPVTLQIRYKRMEEAEKAYANDPVGTRQVDAYTVSRTYKQLSDVY